MSIFNKVKAPKVKKNMFDLSHERKFSLNMGGLYPILLEEVIPGDRFSVNTEHLLRFHPMVAPLMHRIDAYVHYFYVPNRLVFDDWDNFIRGGNDGKDTTSIPQIIWGSTRIPRKRTLADYLGVPVVPESVTPSSTFRTSALPFRAYQLIYSEYYRDENLIPEVFIGKGQTVTQEEVDAGLFDLRKRAWPKDYFTSALPWTQKGDEILIPNTSNVGPPAIIMQNNQVYKPGIAEPLQAGTDGDFESATTGLPLQIDDRSSLSISINDLRSSIHLQKWLERNARAGNRLSEFILAHFGVQSDDLRLGRPQYLGGGKAPITVSEVLATFGSETDGTSGPLGTMGGHGVGVGNTPSFKGTFKEFGHIIGIMSVIPKATYQQGLKRSWFKFDKFDYAFPEFANLGEQPVYLKELYYPMAGIDGDGEKVFGYQSRYAEYKHGVSSVHGDFKDTLSYWHAGRQFLNEPTLNEQFITCNTSYIDDRIFPVADQQATDKLYCQLYNKVKVTRCLPIYGTPTL